MIVNEDEYARRTRAFVRTFIEQTSQRFTAYNIFTGNIYFVGPRIASQLLRNYSHYIIVTEIDWD